MNLAISKMNVTVKNYKGLTKCLEFMFFFLILLEEIMHKYVSVDKLGLVLANVFHSVLFLN